MAAAAAAAAASMLNNTNSNANHYQNQIDNQLNNPSVNSTSNNNNNNSGSVNGNEASMKCAICDRGFEYYSNLRRHIKTKHKIFGKQVKEYVIRHHNGNTQMSQFQQAAALRKQSGSMNEPGAVNEFSFASALKASNNLVLNKPSNSDQASSLASNMMLSPQSYSRTQQNPTSASNLSYMDLALGSSNKTANSNGKNSPLSSLSSSSISSSRSMNRKSNSSSSGSETKSEEKSSHANQNASSNNNNNNDESLDDDMDQAEVGSSASTASSSLSCSASPPLISSSSSSSSKLQFNPSLNMSQQQQQQQQQNIVAAIAAAAAAAAVSSSSNPGAGAASYMSHPQMASLFGNNSKMKTSLIESLLTRKLPTNKYATQSSEESHTPENDASQSKEHNAHKINNLTKLLQNIVEMNQMSQYSNAAVVAAALTRSSQGQSAPSPSASHMQLLENLEKQFNMPLGQLLNGNKMIKSEETESGKLASGEGGVCTKANCDCDGGNLCNYGSSNGGDSEENDESKPNDDKAKDELDLMNINRRRRRRFQEPFSAFQPTKINKKENDDDESDEKNECQNENGDDIDVDIYDDDDNVIGREGSKLNGENSAHNSSANHHDTEMNGNGYYENEMSGDLEENEYQSREEREKEKEDYEENEDEDNEDVRSRTSSSRSSQSAYSSSMSTLSKQNQLAVQASLANKMFLANSPLNQMALENHLRNLTHQSQHHSSGLHHVLPHHHHHHHHSHQLSHAHQHPRNYNLNGMLLHGLQQQQQQQNLHQQARFGIDHTALLNPSGNGIRRKKSKDFGMGSTSSMVQSMRNLQCSPGGNNLDCITPPPPPIASSILMANNSTNPPPSQPNSGDSNNQIRFSTEIWRCPYCCYETTSASRYNSHLVCHGWKPYLCPHCGSRSNRLPDMRTHISTFHPEFNVNTFVVLPEDEAKATLKDYMKNRALINRKLKEMRPQPKFKCKMCPYASLYQFNLTKHVKSVHLSDVYNNNNNNSNSNNNNSSANANDS
jgi:hypothetical protein